jgi:bacteriophage N4 adsorption protein B
MTFEFVDALARVFAYGASGGILFNVVDDLFVDARYLFGGFGGRRQLVTEEELRRVEEKRIAIMLPAWREADVIEQMLVRNVARLDYDRGHYDVFCGTYQNDPETRSCVDAVARRLSNVHNVVVSHDGPTSKADCLNSIYQAIVRHEERLARPFDILLMQDAEDVIHPLALRLYASLIPPNDFVQTPVFSLPLPKRAWVSATYIDEFAEHHLKEMHVREAIGGLVPSAGVGSAFARRAFAEIAAARGQRPFNVDSLTEDYEIGLHFRLAGRRAHFACRAVRRAGGGEEHIATREFFPDGFRASVRQRSRWILGIALQTWGQIGWRGPLAVRYCLWRDRKVLFTNVLLLVAYALCGYVAAREVGAYALGDGWTLERVVPARSGLSWILEINVAFALWRMAMKARMVGGLYGAGHALLSVPRLLVGNVIGILATARAVSQYAAHVVAGRPLRWLKTAHAFPYVEMSGGLSGGLSGEFGAGTVARRRLGEYLLEQHALSQVELDEALALHRATGARLGEVLRRARIVSPHAVVEALAHQFELSVAEPDPRAVSLALLRRLAEELAEELDVLPLEERDGVVLVAAAEPLGDGARQRLESAIGARVEARLTSRESLRSARERAYRRLASAALASGAPARDVALVSLASGARATPDRGKVLGLGLGFCAFHGVVPVRGSASRILCVAPLHAVVRTSIARRVGKVSELVVAPAAVVRVLLTKVEASIPRLADDRLGFGLDAVEWFSARPELPARSDVAHHARRARDAGLSPLEYLEERGLLSRIELSRARARTFGLRLCARGASPAGLLPPRAALQHDVTVLRRDAEGVVLAAPRPTPRLAQDVASLLSPMRVAWSVASKDSKERSSA